jgi:hypothetical protein
VGNVGETGRDTLTGTQGHPSEAQRRYLERGLSQPGGKLPLFDREGREIAHKTIETCIAHGWAESWFANPLKPDWLVCRLTPAGYRALGQQVPDTGSTSNTALES